MDNAFAAKFLQFIFSHQTLLSSPSDLLVVCMTFSRLRILWHADSRQVKNFSKKFSMHFNESVRQGRNTEPRPIVLQILFAYGFSAMMDVPNFFKYDIEDCSNKTSEDAPLDKDCWSFVEVSAITESGWWPTWIAIRSIVIRIIPLLAIIVMNIMIIWKLRQIWKKKKSLFSTAELPSKSRMETTNVGSSVPPISSLAPPEVILLLFALEFLFVHANQASGSEGSVDSGCGQQASPTSLKLVNYTGATHQNRKS